MRWWPFYSQKLENLAKLWPFFLSKKTEHREGREKREKLKFKGENLRGWSDFNKEHKKKFEKKIGTHYGQVAGCGKSKKGKRKVKRESVESDWIWLDQPPSETKFLVPFGG